MLSKAIGIVSWFPHDEPDRGQRMYRINSLFKQIANIFPHLPIIVIAQEWENFKPTVSNHLIQFNFPKLGILEARKKLREKFLELNYDYLIMLDDDAIISECDPMSVKEYLELMDKNPQGFAFCKKEDIVKNPWDNPYADSQLNLCCISKYIYSMEEFPNINPQKNVGFEDRILSMLLHIKYADKEFDVPIGVKSIHFKNKVRPLPSTWAKDKHLMWDELRKNTLKIERYIYDNKDLPEDIEKFLKNF